MIMLPQFFHGSLGRNISRFTDIQRPTGAYPYIRYLLTPPACMLRAPVPTNVISSWKNMIVHSRYITGFSPNNLRQKPPSRGVKYKTSKAKGDALEDRVYRILKRSGAWNIQRNVRVKDTNGNLSEIDLKYGILFPKYIECKHYGQGSSVPLEDVAKFKSVLQLLGVSFVERRATLISTGRFSPRATTIGIRTMDGAALERWESEVNNSFRMRQFFNFSKFVSIGGLFITFGLPPFLDLYPSFSHNPLVLSILDTHKSLMESCTYILQEILRIFYNSPFSFFKSFDFSFFSSLLHSMLDSLSNLLRSSS